MPLPPNVYYQYSILAALGVGLYDGDKLYSKLAEHGDFGLGTFDHLDGELIANEGEFWQMKSTGEALQVDMKAMTTPYAAVTRFVPDHVAQVPTTHTFQSLSAFILSMPEINPNCIVAIRFKAKFEKIVTRTVCAQHAPYRRLVEVTKEQTINDFANESGVLVGFFVPDHLAALAVRGFHLHFLSTDKTRGGHVLEFTAVSKSTLEVANLHHLNIEFPKNDAYKSAALDIPQAELLKAEGGATHSLT